MQTEKQKIVTFTLEYLQSKGLLESDRKGELKELSGLFKRLPSMILTNGLLHTLLFVCSKREKDKEKGGSNKESGNKEGQATNEKANKYDHTFTLIAKWLREKGHVQEEGEITDVLKKLAEMSGRDYVACQEEVLRFTEIVKVLLGAYTYDGEKKWQPLGLETF